MSFNSFDERGNAVMVDVAAKQSTMRRAVAEVVVEMTPEPLRRTRRILRTAARGLFFNNLPG